MIQGSSDIQTCACVGLEAGGLGAGRPSAEGSWLRNAGDVQTSRGDQTLRKSTRHAIEISEAPMSTIQGLMKFEIRNCGIAKETPVTRTAGQTLIIPRQPAKAQISQNGTINEKNGNCRPTIAPSRNGSSPVTLARPAMGVPSAP